MGVLGGAVDENRGPHLTSALLIPPSERLQCTDFDPGPLARPPSHFSVRRFLTVRTCVLGRSITCRVLPVTQSLRSHGESWRLHRTRLKR